MTKARTLADNFAADINAVTANAPLTGGGTSGTVTVGIQAGTTAQSGAVQLTDSTTSTSTTTAATPNSVKSAYDLADAAIAKSIVDAKADLITATADNTPARLAVGSNGDTLVADSSTTTGLRWSPDFASGRNKIINGDFGVNQRNFSSTTANATFIFDRWQTVVAGGTSTISSQTFTPGTAPVAGYEGKNFLRLVSSGQSGASDRTSVSQYIEDSRTLAGQTATISFWAKASTGTPSVAVEFWRSYGTGGSPSGAEFLVSAKTPITASWARYSMTVSIPSLTGKTLGTTDQGFLAVVLFTSAGTNLNTNTQSLGIQSATIDFWGVQVESGSVATPFTTATGTLAGELAACQRYYWRIGQNTDAYSAYTLGFASSTTNAFFVIAHPVNMRVKPTSVDYSTIMLQDGTNQIVPSAISLSQQNEKFSEITATVTGATQFRPYRLINNNSTSGYLGFNAEL